MSLGLLGRKVGMTRVFLEDGTAVPVTVLDVSGNAISQIKRDELDGYCAIQISFGARKAARLSKAQLGHLAKAGVPAGERVSEFVVGKDLLANRAPGDKLSAAVFAQGQKVDVTGSSIGKGFAGAIKRHNFSSNRASHGNSVSHNAPGSIGMAQDPGRVFPGKRMAGHLGAANCTVQNLEIVRIDEGRDLIFVKGATPGARGAFITIRPAVKNEGGQ